MSRSRPRSRAAATKAAGRAPWRGARASSKQVARRAHGQSGPSQDPSRPPASRAGGPRPVGRHAGPGGAGEHPWRVVEAIGAQAFGGAPMKRDTIFRIASMTKPVVAVATLMLIEECRLRLDDPVDEVLPELANRRVLKSLESEVDDTVPANRPISVRDLLTFTFGTGALMV